MKARNARMQDLDELVGIYEQAKHFMHTHGNPGQWNDGHPDRADLAKDIEENTLFVLEDEDGIQGCFKFYVGLDPTYGYIDGSWLNEQEYGVIHRVASAARKKGIGNLIMDTCKQWHPNLKIDTHHDNRFMQALLERNGFVKVGIIYLENGDPRIAYQFVKD